MYLFKKYIKLTVANLGYTIEKIATNRASVDFPVEMSEDEINFIKFVLDKGVTQVSANRLIATALACKYVLDNEIPGDFVECGVWRGGNALLMAELLRLYGSTRRVYLFDTFNGMTKPTELDKDIFGKDAAQMYESGLKDEYSEALGGRATLEEVKQLFSDRGLLNRNIVFVEGDVLETLKSLDLPKMIAVLRLDTDWYESTKLEMEILYPRLVNSGCLLIDDYGHWQGARRAVDEYFDKYPPKPFLAFTDYTGRIAIKNSKE